VSGDEEMKAREGDKVYGHLTQVAIELARKP
jgi:hypothetical protein